MEGLDKGMQYLLTRALIDLNSQFPNHFFKKKVERMLYMFMFFLETKISS